MNVRNLIFSVLAMLLLPGKVNAQSEIYPHHFDLKDVTLLDGPMKTAMDRNVQLLLKYDVDRLLNPYIRQAGLNSVSGKYYGWSSAHPSFPNWGSSDFNLDGHVGGHYLSAISLAYAACHDEEVMPKLKERIDYMVAVMKDCQSVYDDNTEGLKGFIGGQPMNDGWKKLYASQDLSLRGDGACAVPWYVQHKIMAGLRDAYLYGGNADAREVFLKLCDWAILVTSRLSSDQMESMLNTEHGGVNESLLDAYSLTGETKYLTAAKRFTHKTMLNGMQSLNTTFLDGKHANTQVPKYIGMERIGEAGNASYTKAAKNFWQDVATNRTVCIGGNSVSEHFLAASRGAQYIDNLDGPESCNTNNMLKLSEMLADQTHDARYADFYEYATWNHILSTQDPTTGGYVYFTTLRPQGYRIYSTVNESMWCCVGTGMENHSKYGHFIYTRDGSETLYINLFTPSRLVSDDFVVTQETLFPFIDPIASDIPTPQTATSTIIIGKAGSYEIAVRHPSWAGKEYRVFVNGQAVEQELTEGQASYVRISRQWQEGDRINIWLPMELRYTPCPNYEDYISFQFGPILLAAQTTIPNDETSGPSDLNVESLQNEYGHAGRMDHAPGSMATPKNLLSAPLLIGERDDVLKRIKQDKGAEHSFTIDASRPGVETYKWTNLTLRPFYQIHHSRYVCYWYQQTPEAFAQSTMAQTEAENEALVSRTLDFVTPGEQQSEAGHERNFSSDSSKGNYNGESYRDAQAGGFVEYALFNPDGVTENLSILCRFTTADKGRKATLLVDGKVIATIAIPASVKKSENGFYNIEYPIPAQLATKSDGTAKSKFVVRLSASEGTLNPGLYGLRLMKEYSITQNAYQFRAQDWTTGDPNRIPASAITYDTERNVIKAKATGQNNIALSLKYENLDYDIDKSQKYLVVRGTNLSLADGYSYLWWLNGQNRASQVKPTTSKRITVDGSKQTLVAWDMTKSGLYDNFSGDRPNVCIGQTIFGLTSSVSSGACEIHDINFVSDLSLYEDNVTNVAATFQDAMRRAPEYTLQGTTASASVRGVRVTHGRKYVK